jgi:hypothetical protein
MTPWNRIEPSLNEIMREPIIQAVMARDAVRETDVLELMAGVEAAYRDATPRRCLAH